jgi:hypothetical protein
VTDERRFEITFGVLVLEVEELEDERIAYLVVGADGIARMRRSTLGEHGGRVPGESRALIELGGDLAVELTDRPTTAQGFCLIEMAGFRRTRPADKVNVVSP